MVALNDFRPIALTCIISKCFEHILKDMLLEYVASSQDNHQYAYKSKRSTKDACIVLDYLIRKHLDEPRSYARILFIDYSSAFNTILPDVLINKLKSLGVHPSLVDVITSFLCNRTQSVSVNNAKSEKSVTNVGSPQGCVLSPLLFTLYTDSLRSNFDNVHIIKYADDTAIAALLKHNMDDSSYFDTIDFLVDWCADHNLLLNASKTKEMVINFSKTTSVNSPVLVKNSIIERVSSFKYLGVNFNNKLTWDTHFNTLKSKLKQRFYSFYHFCSFNPSPSQRKFYIQSLILPLVMYNCELWFYQCSQTSQNYAKRYFSKYGFDINALVEHRIMDYANNIMKDSSHFLNPNFIVLPRSLRYRSFKSKTSRMLNSFMPVSIRLLNQK